MTVRTLCQVWGVDRLLIETSSPGLRGQSGGPLVDEDGKVCGIQSYTIHYSLKFNVQDQFLHVGRAIHAKSIIEFLDRYNISYQSAGRV